MNDDRQFERSARSWLEIGPTDAPDRVVESALLAIESTAQERDLRVPWTFPRTTSSARFATAAVLCGLTIGGLLLFRGFQQQIAGPSPVPSMTASPRPTRLAVANYADLKGWIAFESRGTADGSTPAEFAFKNTAQVWVVRADGSGLHPLAAPQPFVPAVSPDISPDGQEVVFANLDGQLWVEPIGAGVPTLVSENCGGFANGTFGNCIDTDPAFSPDGTKLAFVREEASAGVMGRVIGIEDLRTRTTTIVESTRLSVDQYQFVSQPTWSPDGSRIAYERTAASASHGLATRVVVVDVDGTGIQELPLPSGLPTTPAGEVSAISPDWSPDGSEIVFSAEIISAVAMTAGMPSDAAPTATFGIYTIHPDGTNATAICTACLGGGDLPSWAPDGQHILFWNQTTWAMMEPDGTNAAPINPKRLTFVGIPKAIGSIALLQPTN